MVRSNIERIGGMVEVDSGRAWHQHDPSRALTLTIIPALTVSSAAAFRYSTLGDRGDCSRQRRIGHAGTVGGAGVATIRGRRMPEISLAEILGLDSEWPDSTRR